MKIIFCNIVWMKEYQGISDSDKPKYYGEYVSEQTAGADIFNFSEYNGKCFGYVRNEGDIVLPDHLAGTFEAASDQDCTIGGVLVVWCAFKDKNTARIVGWYKNALFYRKEQYQPSFTNPEYELDYFFASQSGDCYLLPESQRTFKIERAAKAGKGKGFGRSDIWFADSPYTQNELIPEVVKYIESYDGTRVNFVLTDEMVNALPKEAILENRNDLVQNGFRFFEKEKYLEALSWFNAALRISDSSDVRYYTAYCLYHLAAFDKARIFLEKCHAADAKNRSVLELLAFCSDMTGDWDRTVEYLGMMIDLTQEEDAKEAVRSTIAEIHAYLDAEE